MLTKQEILDRAVDGLRNQNWEPAYSGGNCQYLTTSGHRCAWGHVDTSLTVESCAASYTPLFDTICDDTEFADSLQAAHDSAADPQVRAAARYNFKYGEMENNFRKFAAYHGLVFKEA